MSADTPRARNEDFMTHGARPRASPLMPMDSGLWSGLSTWATTTRTAQATARQMAAAMASTVMAQAYRSRARRRSPCRAPDTGPAAAPPPYHPELWTSEPSGTTLSPSASRAAASTAARCRAELREQLEVFCDGASAPAGEPDAASVRPGAVTAPARVCLVDDPAQLLFTGLVGSYGKVTGTPLSAAFVGRAPAGEDVPDDVQAAAGYLGEGFILEATRLGLGTCWIAGSFDHAGAAKLVELDPGEQVVAVTPLGYPTLQQTGGERLLRTMVKASARLSVEKLAPGILDGGWPQWAVSAVQAARLAPSGANRQPWRFRMDEGDSGDGARGEALLDRAHRLRHRAPARRAGRAARGRQGSWTMLPEPDVARFTPAGLTAPPGAANACRRLRTPPAQAASPERRQSYSSGRRSLR